MPTRLEVCLSPTGQVFDPLSAVQYSQVGNRGGMSVLNGLNGPPNVPRGQGNSPGMQASRGQGSALGGLGGLGPNLQRQPAQNMAGLQRGMGNLGLGGNASELLTPTYPTEEIRMYALR